MRWKIGDIIRDVLGRKTPTVPSTGAWRGCMKCRIGLVPVQTSTSPPFPFEGMP